MDSARDAAEVSSSSDKACIAGRDARTACVGYLCTLGSRASLLAQSPACLASLRSMSAMQQPPGLLLSNLMLFIYMFVLVGNPPVVTLSLL